MDPLLMDKNQLAGIIINSTRFCKKSLTKKILINLAAIDMRPNNTCAIDI